MIAVFEREEEEWNDLVYYLDVVLERVIIESFDIVWNLLSVIFGV